MTRSTKVSALDKDARELHEALSRLVRVYQFRDRTCICYYNVSITQCYAIGTLLAHGPISLNRLAAALYLDKSTASRVVDSLERKGYIRRLVDPNDARALRLEVTRKGKELHFRIEQDLVDEKKQLLEDFDPDVRQATIRLVARLAREASLRFSDKDKKGKCPRD